MASLTEAADVSRIVIKWGFILLVALMVGRMVVGGLIAWYRAANPVIPPPTVGFGIIPPLQFPENKYPGLTYTLETVTGTLPVFETQADVMHIPRERPNLLAMERSSKEAVSLGFNVSPEKASDVTYRWRLQAPIPSTLTMQIYDGRFLVETDWASNPNFLSERNLPAKAQAIKDAKDVVRRVASGSGEDLIDDAALLTYLKGNAGMFQPAISLSDADFVRVDLFRAPHKGLYPFVTPVPDHGIVRVVLSGNQRLAKVVYVNYNYAALDMTRVETYPLKPVEQAWQELQDGRGYVAHIDKGVTQAVVRRVELGYYDSFEPQEYAQPVYIFSGDNDFVAYVQAVKDPKVPVEAVVE